MKTTIIDKSCSTPSIAQDTTMAITTPPGSKIKFKGCCQESVDWGSCDDPNSIFTVGQILTLRKCEVHSWHTKVYVEEHDGAFPSVAFTNVIEETLPPSPL